MNLEENKSIPNGAGGYYYLGFVCERQGKTKEASECYQKALQLQPSLWCAFERLCHLLGGSKSSAAYDYISAEHRAWPRRRALLVGELERLDADVLAQFPFSSSDHEPPARVVFEATFMTYRQYTAVAERLERLEYRCIHVKNQTCRTGETSTWHRLPAA